jgi:hypothetical protein
MSVINVGGSASSKIYDNLFSKCVFSAVYYLSLDDSSDVASCGAENEKCSSLNFILDFDQSFFKVYLSGSFYYHGSVVLERKSLDLSSDNSVPTALSYNPSEGDENECFFTVNTGWLNFSYLKLIHNSEVKGLFFKLKEAGSIVLINTKITNEVSHEFGLWKEGKSGLMNGVNGSNYSFMDLDAGLVAFHFVNVTQLSFNPSTSFADVRGIAAFIVEDCHVDILVSSGPEAVFVHYVRTSSEIDNNLSLRISNTYFSDFVCCRVIYVDGSVFSEVAFDNISVVKMSFTNTSSFGGFIYLKNVVSLLFANSSLASLGVTKTGAALCVKRVKTVVIQTSSFTSCEVSGVGGAIYFEFSSIFICERSFGRCNFSRNTAGRTYGVDIYDDGINASHYYNALTVQGCYSESEGILFYLSLEDYVFDCLLLGTCPLRHFYVEQGAKSEDFPLCGDEKVPCSSMVYYI